MNLAQKCLNALRTTALLVGVGVAVGVITVTVIALVRQGDYALAGLLIAMCLFSVSLAIEVFCE